MPRQSHRNLILRTYLISMLVRMVFTLLMGSVEEQAVLLAANLLVDLEILHTIRNTQYLLPHTLIPKHSNIHLVREYSQDVLFQDRFKSMLRVSPYVYEVLINLISNHPVFQNQSHNQQTPVWIQLAITLYRLGHYGNSASVHDVSQNFGFLEGAVEKFTQRCFTVHWGQGPVYWAGTSQVHRKEMDSVPCMCPPGTSQIFSEFSLLVSP